MPHATPRTTTRYVHASRGCRGPTNKANRQPHGGADGAKAQASGNGSPAGSSAIRRIGFLSRSHLWPSTLIPVSESRSGGLPTVTGTHLRGSRVRGAMQRPGRPRRGARRSPLPYPMQQVITDTSRVNACAASLIASEYVGKTCTVSMTSSMVRPSRTASVASWMISAALVPQA